MDPGVKYTVTAKAKGETCIAKVSEGNLRDISETNAAIWLNMSKMLASRLKQANERKSNKEPRSKPKIFIGSSTEGLNVALKIQSEFSYDYDPIIWNQGLFNRRMGNSYLECLEDIVNQFDYGVFVFTPDDKIESRGITQSIARDNVIFELGMFVGKLNRNRAFIVYPRNIDLKILSDFHGVIMGGYDAENKNLRAAIAPVCDQIRESINYQNIT